MTTATQYRWIAGPARVSHAFAPRARLSLCGYQRRPYKALRGDVVCLRCEGLAK